MLKTLNIDLPPKKNGSYPIVIGPELIQKSATWLPKNKRNVVIITDDRVQEHYAKPLIRSLQETGKPVRLLSFPGGETSKNIATKCYLEEQMLTQGCDRDTLVVALGGGVVGDLAGFIAATYMRGIDYIHIPTTLLAMIDSSIGGKTGIDTPQGKNLIGAFWQPKAVISDITCLKSLSQQQFINGLIEGVKIFLTHDAKAFYALDHHLESLLHQEDHHLIEFIYHAVALKAKVVIDDETEQNQRAVLNFGHTMGHALEHLSHYQLLHGYAVGLGLLLETKIAQCLGLLHETDYQVIKTFLLRLGLSTQDLKHYNVDDVIHQTQSDKKNRAGVAHYVLLSEIGQVYEKNHRFAHPVSDDLVKEAFLKTIED